MEKDRAETFLSFHIFYTKIKVTKTITLSYLTIKHLIFLRLHCCKISVTKILINFYLSRYLFSIREMKINLFLEKNINQMRFSLKITEVATKYYNFFSKGGGRAHPEIKIHTVKYLKNFNFIGKTFGKLRVTGVYPLSKVKQV